MNAYEVFVSDEATDFEKVSAMRRRHSRRKKVVTAESNEGDKRCAELRRRMFFLILELIDPDGPVKSQKSR